MAFLCFFCKERDAIEWHDVEEGFEPYQPPRKTCRASVSASGRQGSRATTSAGTNVRSYPTSPSYSIIEETLDELEARGTYNLPRPPLKNKRARKVVKFLKVDIRVPRQEGRGTKKVVRLVKIDIRPRPDAGGDGKRKVLDLGAFVSSAHEGWPFRQFRPGPSTRGEIREESESPEVGFFNSPDRERAGKILRGSRGYRPDVGVKMNFGFLGSSPSSSRGLKQRPARPRQEIFECDAPKDVFVSSPSNKSPSKVWPRSRRQNRPRDEIFHCPSGSNRSGGSVGLQSPNQEIMGRDAWHGNKSPSKVWPRSRRQNRPRDEIFHGPSGSNRSGGSVGLQSPNQEIMGRDAWHNRAISGLQSPNRLEKETSERPVSHGWAIRGLESPNRIVPKTYKRAMSHSGAIRGLLSSNSPGEETYERARSGSGSVKGLQSPNRTTQEIYARAKSHSGAMRSLQSPNRNQSPNRTVEEIYARAMSHSGAIRSLQSPSRNLDEFDEETMNPSGKVESLQSPNRNLEEVQGRPLSHSGAIRCLESPSRSPHSANRSRQDSGAFASPSPDAGSRRRLADSPGEGSDSKQLSNVYRQSDGESGEIKLAEG